MLDIKKDLTEFYQSLERLGLDKSLGEKISEAIVNQLNGYTHTRIIPLSYLLNCTQMLTIQQFLCRYGFHIEFYRSEKDETKGYSIIPNWK